MAELTKIAWADSTWNPWWGCSKVSPGCTHCYANTLAERTGSDIWGPGKQRKEMKPAYWAQLRKWDAQAATGRVGKDGKRWFVFLGDMCDLFDDEGIAEARERMWDEVRACTHLTFLVLTKRPQNFVKYLPADWGAGYANVWLGVTVDDRKHGYPRVDILRRTPAVYRFLSCEPLLEDISDIDLTGIDWAIVGGESGGGSREFDLAWARGLRDRCAEFGTTFFFKQLGSKPTEDESPFKILNKQANGKRDMHGKDAVNFPEDLNIQHWPDRNQVTGKRTYKAPNVNDKSVLTVLAYLMNIAEDEEAGELLRSTAITAHSAIIAHAKAECVVREFADAVNDRAVALKGRAA